MPDEELEELTGIYEKKGLSRGTAEIVAKELTAHDAFSAHVEAELGIDPNNLTKPLNAVRAYIIHSYFHALIRMQYAPLVLAVIQPVK